MRRRLWCRHPREDSRLAEGANTRPKQTWLAASGHLTIADEVVSPRLSYSGQTRIAIHCFLFPTEVAGSNDCIPSHVNVCKR